MLNLGDRSPANTRHEASRERTPFATLWRVFFAQLFTSESVTSDVHLRQSIISILSFLIVPAIFLLIELFPDFQSAVIRAKAGRGPLSRVDDLLAWMAFLFTTYSMVSTGFITVLSWDSLTFGRRDAMVLGPLPLTQRTILVAKLCALGGLLLLGAVPVNLLNAFVFAVETSDQATGGVLVRHFVAFFATTVGAGILSFAGIVLLRGAVSALGGPWLTAACAPPLQFLCVVGLLSLMVCTPFVLHISFLSASVTNWMPPGWFVGVFETLRGSARAADPAFPFAMLARRATTATPIAVAGAFALSTIEFRRQMRLALTPSASVGVLGRAHIGRLVATLIMSRNPTARASTDFILLTLARNRAQQAASAITVAIGTTIILAALAANTRDFASLMRPRTAILWVPLVIGYSMAIGLRASFFVPSELPASWAFRTNAVEVRTMAWCAVRASMIAFVLPRTLLVTALLVPLLGWRVTAWYSIIVGLIVVLLAEVMALTVEHLPFTRAYEPGHAKLKTRWWAYAVGLYLFAYWPARFVLLALNQPNNLLLFMIALLLAVGVLEFVGRRRAGRESQPVVEMPVDELSSVTVLDLSPGA